MGQKQLNLWTEYKSNGFCLPFIVWRSFLRNKLARSRKKTVIFVWIWWLWLEFVYNILHFYFYYVVQVYSLEATYRLELASDSRLPSHLVAMQAALNYLPQNWQPKTRPGLYNFWKWNTRGLVWTSGKPSFYWKCDQTLEYAIQGGCGVSLPGGTQKPSGQSSVTCPAWARRLDQKTSRGHS